MARERAEVQREIAQEHIEEGECLHLDEAFKQLRKEALLFWKVMKQSERLERRILRQTKKKEKLTGLEGMTLNELHNDLINRRYASLVKKMMKLSRKKERLTEKEIAELRQIYQEIVQLNNYTNALHQSAQTIYQHLQLLLRQLRVEESELRSEA